MWVSSESWPNTCEVPGSIPAPGLKKNKKQKAVPDPRDIRPLSEARAQDQVTWRRRFHHQETRGAQGLREMGDRGPQGPHSSRTDPAATREPPATSAGTARCGGTEGLRPWTQVAARGQDPALSPPARPWRILRLTGSQPAHNPPIALHTT
jgi:hypothetical protein